MTQGVHLAIDPRRNCVALEALPHSLPGQGLASLVDKQGPLSPVAEQQGPALGKVTLEPGGGHLTDRNQTFLTAFADNPQDSLLRKVSVQGQLRGLRDPQAAGIDKLEQATVPQARRAVRFNDFQKPVYLLLRKNLRQRPGRPRGLEGRRGIEADQSVPMEVTKERTDRAQALGGCSSAGTLELPVYEILDEHGGRDFRQLDLIEPTVFEEQACLEQVRIDGSLRQPYFRGEVIGVGIVSRQPCFHRPRFRNPPDGGISSLSAPSARSGLLPGNCVPAGSRRRPWRPPLCAS